MFKRNEGFRYNFPQPIEGKIYISTVTTGIKKTSNKADIRLWNISPRGCSFTSGLHFPNDPNLLINIELKLNEQILITAGTIVWKRAIGGQISYGMRFISTEEVSEALTKEIKQFAINNR